MYFKNKYIYNNYTYVELCNSGALQRGWLAAISTLPDTNGGLVKRNCQFGIGLVACPLSFAARMPARTRRRA